MKHLLIIISKLFTWIGFGKIQKDFELIDKLLESQKKTENGQGTETLPDGKKYVGEFKDGKFHGQGTMTSPDGIKYVGEFKDGKYHGQGIQTIPNQGKYVGEWKDDIAWNGIIFDKNEKILAKRKNGEDTELSPGIKINRLQNEIMDILDP